MLIVPEFCKLAAAIMEAPLVVTVMPDCIKMLLDDSTVPVSCVAVLYIMSPLQTPLARLKHCGIVEVVEDVVVELLVEAEVDVELVDVEVVELVVINVLLVEAVVVVAVSEENVLGPLFFTFMVPNFVKLVGVLHEGTEQYASQT